MQLSLWEKTMRRRQSRMFLLASLANEQEEEERDDKEMRNDSSGVVVESADSSTPSGSHQNGFKCLDGANFFLLSFEERMTGVMGAVVGVEREEVVVVEGVFSKKMKNWRNEEKTMMKRNGRKKLIEIMMKEKKQL
jgi:hypothetical protein